MNGHGGSVFCDCSAANGKQEQVIWEGMYKNKILCFKRK